MRLKKRYGLSKISALPTITRADYAHLPQIIETYVQEGLSSIFLRPVSPPGHVDLRSPNPAGRDSLVVDYDGMLYPSDESRMLARLRRIDLSIGHIDSGIDPEKTHQLSWNQRGETNEDCIHCADQPFCGVESIDDITRYDRTDLPRHQTRFCRDQMALFDFIFRKIEQSDPVALANFNGHLNGDFHETPFLAPPYLVEAP